LSYFVQVSTWKLECVKQVLRRPTTNSGSQDRVRADLVLEDPWKVILFYSNLNSKGILPPGVWIPNHQISPKEENSTSHLGGQALQPLPLTVRLHGRLPAPATHNHLHLAPKCPLVPGIPAVVPSSIPCRTIKLKDSIKVPKLRLA
jgi:hypothetical protein